MKRTINNYQTKRFAAGYLVLGVTLVLTLLAPPTHAQDRPTQRQLRTYIPPDQLVSFLPETPFDRFVEFLNPIFQRVTGKQVIDPESRTEPIAISIAGMHFLDALELVLDYKGLRYRETDRYFIVENAPAPQGLAGPEGATAARTGPAPAELPATLASREIQINAILFDLNHTKARDLGINWDVFFGDQQQQQGGGGGQGGASGQNTPRFFLRTDDVFKGVDDLIRAPELIDFSDLTQFFRLLESNGVGETIASPQVTVQSAEQGRIQIGSDIPVQVRDFAGNTVTQFFSTGIIVEVVPTLIEQALADTVGAPTVEFIHLNVRVEKSSGRPTTAGITIDRNTATTQVTLLDGEQTVIGGLNSTDEVKERRGIPVLKDLPGWFFGLRYVFGRTQTSHVQRELLIALQARVVDPLAVRAQRPLPQNLLERTRRQVEESLRRFSTEVADDADTPQGSGTEVDH